MRVKRGLTRFGLVVAACAAAVAAIDGWSDVATAKRAHEAGQQAVSAAQARLDFLRERSDSNTQGYVESVYSTIGARVRSIYDNNTKTMTDVDVGRKTAELWLQLPEATQAMVLSGDRPDDQDQFFEFLALLRGERSGRQITLSESTDRLSLFQEAIARSKGHTIYSDTRQSFSRLGELYPVDDPESRAQFTQAEIESAELGLLLDVHSALIKIDGRFYNGPGLADAYKSFVVSTLGAFLLVAGIWTGVVFMGSWIVAGFRT